jgi:arginyl-tRNA synthetase
MKPVIDILEERISAAMAEVAGQKAPAIVRLATDTKFGDYQVNGVMALAKELKTNPKKLAEKVVEKLNLSDICEEPEIAGPGFINLRLKPGFVAANLLGINKDAERLGIKKADKPKTIVVDFSGPNIAKDMHVGHLRSTIIGDCIWRTLEFLGHNIKSQNHVGDWGTNFGMVILGLWHICMAERRNENNPYYKSELEELKTHTKDKNKLDALCQNIRNRHEEDWREDFLNELGDGEKVFYPFLRDSIKYKTDDIWPKMLSAYQYINLIEDSTTGMGLTIPTRQAGTISYEALSRHVTAMTQDYKNDKNLQEYEAWKFIRELTLEKCNEVYKRLNVKLTDEHVCGESFYKDMLPDIVKELLSHKIAEKSEGAVCVFPEGFKDKEGEPLPVIVQKSDGAYLYATTDLAAIQYRVGELKADRIIYVTDARQQLHFEMVFAVARMADWAKNTELVHVIFGSVLGEDGKPLKTREGENVKLKELLDEAVERARSIVKEKNPDLPNSEKDKIANAVGIGAVKYADYSNNRTSDYVFSFDKMLAMEGNTAPYMQYAYARVQSIKDKGKERGIAVDKEIDELRSVSLAESSELDLAKHLIRYGEAIEAAVGDYRPNYLTSYLYELAQKFSVFYTNCPVLDAGPDKRPTRLLLCDLTAKTIKHGLSELLGIEVVEQM